MGFLDDLLGGGQQQKANELRDFVSRYEQGSPGEGYSDEEVLDRYGAVVHEVPRDQYAQAAQDALARMSPEERVALARTLLQQAQSRGMAVPQEIGTSPGDLGSLLTDLHRKPGLVREMLGGDEGGGARDGTAGPLGSPVARAALAGIAAMLVKRYLSR